jgi:tRNA uridine 5-carboxymethylaminomethyl modification enzyme
MGSERRTWFSRRQAERTAWAAAMAGEVEAKELAAAGLPVGRDGGRKPLSEWLRYSLTLNDLAPWLDAPSDLESDLATELVEDALYAPYLERQEGELRDMRASAAVAVGHLAYDRIPGLSREMVERLEAARPATLADAARVRGITPAALAAILVHARRGADAA